MEIKEEKMPPSLWGWPIIHLFNKQTFIGFLLRTWHSRSPQRLLGSQLCQGLSGGTSSGGPDLQASAAPPFLATFELETAQVSPLLFLPHVTSVFSCLGGETEAKEGTGKHHFSGQEATEQTGEEAKVDVGPLLSFHTPNP